MLRSKFEKYKTNKTWEAYRKQRNLVTKLKRKSINTYFQERYTGGQKSKHFYTTVKPFLSKKSTGSQQKIVLVENDKIVNNTKDICDTFNTFFVNVANDIGKDVIFDGNSHPSILKIKNNTQHNTLFDFKPTDVDTINKLVSKINIKKATGVDQISSKLLRAGAPVLNKHITTLVNNTIKTSVFPTRLKEAQVVPLHKKNDPLDKKNYRPVSILPTISKVYEMVLSDQLTDLFENIFHTFLCAFRKGHGCQTTLLRLLEDWKTALDKNQYVAAILMDLSKAFDCLPYDILLCKLSAYGLSPKSVELLRNYLTGRKQQIKLQGDLSSWADIQKGVPQGSILGSLLFKIFINDIFYFIEYGTLYNYADDNTLSYVNDNYEKLIDILEKESSVLIDWFKFNCMQANPDKFQAIAVGNKTHAKTPVFKIDSAEITCDEVVKLLGIDIDYQLNFNYHIKNICRKASQQLNALKRIGCFLSKLNKLTIFHTFILSNFNFCPLAWHFCNKSNTSKLEKIQARALRFIYEDYESTYDELLEKAKVPSLKVRRMRTMAIECFKILNKLSPSCLHDLVVFKDCKYNFRYSNIVDIPRVRTSTYGKNSFKYAAAVLWNDLPDDFRKISNFNQFKNILKSWNGNVCKCSACADF